MATQVDPRVVVYPYELQPSRIGPDDLWGGTGGPVMDDTPDGTPGDVKKRLGQILVQGAQTILAALQYRVAPLKPRGSDERPGSTIGGADVTVGGRTGTGTSTTGEAMLKIEGQARSITLGGILVLGGLVALVFFAARR